MTHSMSHDTQHEFLPTLVVAFFHEISVGNNLYVLYLDFTKAFDTINHDITFQKLKSEYKIDDSMLNFIKEY